MIECKVATLSTFLGPVTVVETARGVRHVDLLDDGARQFAREAAGRFLRLPGEPECAQEFRDYFAGRLRAFTCPMDLVGTDFQRRCWLAVERSVPFGETITYAQEARLAGTTSYQAVGQANRRNPLAIRIPCHRVVASGGPGGYFAGRPDLKRALLRFEGWAWPEEWDALVPNAAEIPDAGALTRPGER